MWSRALVLSGLFAACAAPSSSETAEVGQESARPGPIATRAAPDPIAAYAGRWIQRGPYNILGRGTDQIWTIAEGKAGWTIELTLVHHPSVNEKTRTITREELPAVPLEWMDGALSFADPRTPAVQRRITVDIRDGMLHLPALVQRDERTWEYRSWNEGGVFRCADDPLRVPTGPATHTFERWSGPSIWKTTQVDSIYARGERVPAIEFRQTSPQGVDELCAALVLEPTPGVPYVRTYYQFVEFAGQSHERLTADEWAAVRSLPDSTRGGDK